MKKRTGPIAPPAPFELPLIAGTKKAIDPSKIKAIVRDDGESEFNVYLKVETFTYSFDSEQEAKSAMDELAFVVNHKA